MRLAVLRRVTNCCVGCRPPTAVGIPTDIPTGSSPVADPMPLVFSAIAGVIGATGLAMILSAVRREHRDRRRCSSEATVSDQAEAWLRSQ